jgi:hypothetical protein
VLRVERIVRDRKVGSRWQVYGTARRPRSPVTPWRRSVARWAERLRCHDTGTQVFGGPRQALRLARAHPGHGYEAAARVAVRPLDGRWRVLSRYWDEEEGDRRLYWMILWALATAISAASAFGCAGFARWFWCLVALLGLFVTVSWGLRLHRTPSAEGVLLALVAAGALSVILLRPGSDGWAANGRRHAFIVLVLPARRLGRTVAAGAPVDVGGVGGLGCSVARDAGHVNVPHHRLAPARPVRRQPRTLPR